MHDPVYEALGHDRAATLLHFEEGIVPVHMCL